MTKKPQEFDYVIFGAGLFGLYGAELLAAKGLRVALVEADPEVFGRASRINQARVHLGYHYPRSLSTAKAAAATYEKFRGEFPAAINQEFTQIYGVSNRNSFTSAAQFLKFCRYMGLPANEVDPGKYFKEGAVEGAYETIECAFDADRVLDALMGALKDRTNFTLLLNERLVCAVSAAGLFELEFRGGLSLKTPAVLNATYAGINQVLKLFGFAPFDVKYEISEVALGEASPDLRRLGITVMDGPFFSLMPYGHSEFHTLTAVDYTPRRTCFSPLPTFACQNQANGCSPLELKNCNPCPDRPATAAPYMLQAAKKYLRDSFAFRYEKSLFAMKAILNASEIDDSRPTVVRVFSKKPYFVSVLSGKINTIHELHGVLP